MVSPSSVPHPDPVPNPIRRNPHPDSGSLPSRGHRPGPTIVGMHLIDRSPGGFIFAANAVLYAVVLLETWMLTTGSIVVMFLMMLVIVAVAGLLARFIMDLMGSEEYVDRRSATRRPSAARARRHDDDSAGSRSGSAARSGAGASCGAPAGRITTTATTSAPSAKPRPTTKASR